MKLRLILIISLLALGGLYWWQSTASQKTRIVFCDVGQGDGIIIEQGETQMIVDAGPKNGKMAECLGKYIPFWDKTIEMAIMTHGDADHDGGLPGVKLHYQIEQLYYSDKLAQNDVVRLGTIDFEILSVGDSNTNEGSVVGMLKYHNKKILLTGDATAEVEQRLVWRKILRQAQDDGRIDVLKVSHHGSETATSKELLELIRPKTAVISVGKNSFGHPRREVLERLAAAGAEILRTDKLGDVVMELD